MSRSRVDQLIRGATAATIVATLLLCLLAPCAADDLTLIRVVWDPDNAWFRWDYRLDVTIPEAGGGTSYTLSGLHNVLAAGVVEAAPLEWSTINDATTVTWQTSASLDAGLSYPDPGSDPATAFFWYASTSSDQGTVPWTRDLSGEVTSGTTGGAAEPAEDYAFVSVWDNHLGFGALDPDEGTHASPAPVIADQTPGSAWGPTALVPGAGDIDIAGIRVETTRRLQMSINMNGHLRRVQSDGSAFAAGDTRRSDPGPYELSTQWKAVFRGRYLDLAENQYLSPTSGTLTDFDVWTGWDGAGTNNPAENSGWLWPSSSDAWSGELSSGMYGTVTGVDLYIERGQHEGGPAGPAELWITERLRRRGLQDAMGNYAQTVTIELTVAE